MIHRALTFPEGFWKLALQVIESYVSEFNPFDTHRHELDFEDTLCVFVGLHDRAEFAPSILLLLLSCLSVVSILQLPRRDL